MRYVIIVWENMMRPELHVDYDGLAMKFTTYHRAMDYGIEVLDNKEGTEWTVANYG